MSTATQPQPPAIKNAPSLVPAAELDQILRLDQTAKAANAMLLTAERDRNHMAKGMILARSMQTLRSLMTPAIMADCMHLMNSPLGFRTDRPNQKQPTPYDVDVVRDVLIQALIRGLRPTGNEFNIIAGNLYVTKEGFQRLLQEFPGLKNLCVEIGVPGMKGEGALVPCRASWTIDGCQDMLVCEPQRDGPDYSIPVRVNAAMGIDAIQGKAKSKLYRRIFERLTGTVVETEADIDDPIESTATKQA